MALLTVRNLTVGYDTRPVLDQIHFTVEPGNYLCIVGENGSGKTTLMKTILGLLPPLAGEVLFEDGLSAREIGYLPQQTVVQKDFPASVKEVVLSGFQGKCGLRPFYLPEEKAFALTAMEKMGVLPLADRCFRQLSGGQRQRVLLARAFCAAQTLLLLDEPVSGLDPQATADMYRQIAKLNQKDGAAVMMITHDMSAAVTCASHILHLGNRPWFGTVQEYKNSRVGRNYLAIKGGALS